MRVTFLGSSHGVPEPNRKCSCILLEVSDRKYLIDAGTNPTDGLVSLGLSPVSVNAVFITHQHGDHTDGLVPFCDLLSWYFKAAKPAIYVPKLSIRDGIAAFLACNGIKLREDIEFHAVSEGCFYDDGTVKVSAFRTGHIDVSYAYLVEAEGKKVLFTGDMKHKDGPVADYARISDGLALDLAVAECAHFSGMLYLDALEANPPKRFWFNHYSDRFIASCLELKKTLADKVEIRMATDGAYIDV